MTTEGSSMTESKGRILPADVSSFQPDELHSPGPERHVRATTTGSVKIKETFLANLATLLADSRGRMSDACTRVSLDKLLCDVEMCAPHEFFRAHVHMFLCS